MTDLTPNPMPSHLRKRQPGGEEARFRWAFEECLRLRPDKAPSPINTCTPGNCICDAAEWAGDTNCMGEVVGIAPERHRGCSHEGCNRYIRDHYHSKIEAGAEGWFFQKDNTQWCPDHMPEWVPAWREKKRKGTDL